MSETARNVAAIAAALGVVGLLAPLPLLRSEAQRAAALALTLASWGFLLASLVPDGDASAGIDRLSSPANAGAAPVLNARSAVGPFSSDGGGGGGHL